MGGISIDQKNHPVVTWRGVVVCAHSVPQLNAWAKSVGNSILLSPLAGCGSYQTSTVASAGTHAGGGAIDIDLRNVPANMRAFVANQGRLAGFQVAWHRDYIAGLWTWHCHALDPNCTKLSAAAVGQVIEFLNGGDGLVGTTRDRNVRTNVEKIRSIFNNRGKVTPPPAPAPVKPAPVQPKPAEVPDMTQMIFTGPQSYIPVVVPNDGRQYAIDICYSRGADATKKVSMLTFARQGKVSDPSKIVRNMSWDWRRDVPGRITLLKGEGNVSISFAGTSDQYLAISITPTGKTL